MAGIAEPAFSGIAYVDPRLARMGARIVGNSARVTEELDIAGIILGPEGDYHSRRLSLGISMVPGTLSLKSHSPLKATSKK